MTYNKLVSAFLVLWKCLIGIFDLFWCTIKAQNHTSDRVFLCNCDLWRTHWSNIQASPSHQKWFHRCTIHHREYFGGQPLWVYACKIAHSSHWSKSPTFLTCCWLGENVLAFRFFYWIFGLYFSTEASLTIHLLKRFVVVIRTRYWIV